MTRTEKAEILELNDKIKAIGNLIDLQEIMKNGSFHYEKTNIECCNEGKYISLTLSNSALRELLTPELIDQTIERLNKELGQCIKYCAKNREDKPYLYNNERV